MTSLPCKEPRCGGGGRGGAFMNLVAGEHSVATGRPQLPVPGTEGRAPHRRGVGWLRPQGTFQGALHLCPVVQQLQGLLPNKADARTGGPHHARTSGPLGVTCVWSSKPVRLNPKSHFPEAVLQKVLAHDPGPPGFGD